MKQIKKLNIAMVCSLMLAGSQISCMGEHSTETVIPKESSVKNDSNGQWARFKSQAKELWNGRYRRGPAVDEAQKNNGQPAKTNMAIHANIKDAYERAIYKTDDQGNFIKSNGNRVYPANGDTKLLNSTNINSTDQTGDTALHVFAKAKGDFVDTGSRDSYAQELLKKNANPNLQNALGNTPLHEAINAGNFEIVKHLTGAGADLNIRNKEGQTPLMIAAKAGNLEMVKALLAAKDKNGYPANVYVKNIDDGTALHDAAAYGTPEIVKELLASGSFINAQEKNGITPLQAFYYNTHNNNIASAEALIDSGASEHIKNYKGDEAGYYISENGERLRKFNKFSYQKKSFGIDPKTKITPLMRAIQNSDIPLARALIAQGADVNAKDIYGNTALHYLNSMEIKTTNGRSGLSQETRNRIGNSLIDAGANKEAKNKEGVRAKDVQPKNSMFQGV